MPKSAVDLRKLVKLVRDLDNCKDYYDRTRKARKILECIKRLKMGPSLGILNEKDLLNAERQKALLSELERLTR